MKTNKTSFILFSVLLLLVASVFTAYAQDEEPLAAYGDGLELVSEPSYEYGTNVPYGQMVIKEWIIRNTGTETWTTDYRFVFDSGWQIGNTSFAITKEVAPGETYNVILWLTPRLVPNREYFSTYALMSPDNDTIGYITADFTVVGQGYYDDPTISLPWPDGLTVPGRPDYCTGPGCDPGVDPWR